MLAVECILGRIESVPYEALQRVRSLRYNVRRDKDLSDIERATVGLTGSREILQRWQSLYKLMGAHHGAEIVTIDDPAMQYKRYCAGIIVGDAAVRLTTSENTKGAQGIASLVVPVENMACLERHTIRSGVEIGPDEGVLTLAKIALDEAANTTCQPEKDYACKFATVLVGQAVSGSMHYSSHVEELMAVVRGPAAVA